MICPHEEPQKGRARLYELSVISEPRHTACRIVWLERMDEIRWCESIRFRNNPNIFLIYVNHGRLQ